MRTGEIERLLDEGVKVANIGLQDFAVDIEAQTAPVVQVLWTPPVQLEKNLEKLLDDLL